MSRSRVVVQKGRALKSSVKGVTSLIWLLTTLAMVGCLQGDKKSEEVRVKTYGKDTAASFIVPRFFLVGMPSETEEPWTDVAVARNYRAEACINFRATQNQVISQEFQVEDEAGVVIHKGETDANGCLSWGERIPFNFFGAARFMEIERTLRGSGVVRGYQKVKFALDPWKESRGGTHPEWEYLNQPNVTEQSEVPPELLIKGSENVVRALNAGFQHRLLAENVKVNIQQERVLTEGVEVSMNLEMSPFVQLRRMDGSVKNFSFNEGQFTVYASIVGKGLRGYKVFEQGKTVLQPGERVRRFINNRETGDRYLFGHEYTLSAEELRGLEDKRPEELRSLVGKDTWTSADSEHVELCREMIESRQWTVRTSMPDESRSEEFVEYVTNGNCGPSVTDVNGNLTPMLKADSVKMINGKLRVAFENFNVEYHNTDGNMYFALHVVPEGIPSDILTSFAAVHRLGNFNNWIGTETPILVHDNDDFSDEYEELMLSLPERGLEEKTREYYQRRGIRKLQAYMFSPLKIAYTSVKPGETATQRTIAYDINVQVSQPLRGGIPAQDLRMLIRTNGSYDRECIHGRMPITQEPCEMKFKEFYAVPTDQHGRVGWQDEVSHSYYEVEHFIRKPITFVVLSDKAEERFETTIDAAINPWDLFATFGKDVRYDKSAKALLEEYEEWAAGDRSVPYKIESEFNVDKFDYTAIKFDYTIDEDLSLEVRKTVLFKIDPFVQRYSSIIEGRRIERLRDGVWLMKVAIQKDYLDPSKKGAQIIRNCQGMPEYVEPGQKFYGWVENSHGKMVCEQVVAGESQAELTEEEKQARAADIFKVDERHFITFQKRLVRVINGRINTPVTMSMRDLRLMRIRSNMVIQLEPIDETKLGVANWLREVIDKRAQIEERLRDEQVSFFFSDAEEALEKVLNWFTLGETEDENGDIVRSDIVPQDDIVAEREREGDNSNFSRDDVLRIYDQTAEIEGVEGDHERYQRGIREQEAKRNYWEQRRNIIDNFIRDLDSDLIRKAYSDNRLDLVNRELWRVAESEDGLRDMLMPVDMSKYTEGQSGGRIYGDEVKQHYFWQEGNQEIDVGLLHAINSRFQMDAQEMALRRLNDFSTESLGAAFSLDLLVEPFEVSGLRKRSFIGPVTFLINSNGSHIRPTDTMAEVFCKNNSCHESGPKERARELKDWTWEGDKSFMYRRFYNSVRHYFNKHVDDLIICKLGGIIDDPGFCGPNMPYDLAFDDQGQPIMNADGEQKAEFLGYDELRERRLDVSSLIPNFLEQNDLKYVAINENAAPLQAFRFDDPNCNVKTSHIGFGETRRRNSDCFYDYYDSVLPNAKGQKRPVVIHPQDFVSKLNGAELMSEEDIRAWISNVYERSRIQDEQDVIEQARLAARDCRENNGGMRNPECVELYEAWRELAPSVGIRFQPEYVPPEELQRREAEKEQIFEAFQSGIGKDELREFVYGEEGYGPRGGKELLIKMCSWMISDLIGKLEEQDYIMDDSRRKDRMIKDMFWTCIKPDTLDFQHPFIRVDEKIRVYETGEFRFKGGKSMNVQVSAKTGIDQKDAVGAGHSWNLVDIATRTTGGLIGGAAGFFVGSFPGMIAGGAVGMELFKKLPSIGSSMGWGYSLKWESGAGRSNGTDLSLGTYLVMQNATFDIQLEEFERCAVLKFDTIKLLEETRLMSMITTKNIMPDDHFPLSETDEERAKAQTAAIESGVMICTGDVEIPASEGKMPKAVRERYYYFTQHFTEGDMLDSGDLYNHPWLLMLRGRRDFNIFMAGLNQFSINPRAHWDMRKPWKMLDMATGGLGEPITMVNEYEWPIENMIRTYLDVTPTFPGLYTALPEEPRDFPWGSAAADESFSERTFSGMGHQAISVEMGQMTRDMQGKDPECAKICDLVDGEKVNCEDVNQGGTAWCARIPLDRDKLREHNIDGMFDLPATGP
ncbi:MAG: hypothetical protein HRT45_16515 [Bdellovibrionales bacterium]|nr:hypothetical protein [Bdellovibrionales bacterium]